MKTETIFVLHTDKDGASFIREHRVWDRQLFLQSLAEAAVKVGGAAKTEQVQERDYERSRSRAGVRR